MGLVGARVPVESEKMKTFLDNAFWGCLEGILFFFGSAVMEDEAEAEVEEVDTGFWIFEDEGFTRRGIDDAVVDVDGMMRLVIVGRGLVGDIIINLMMLLAVKI